MAKKNEVTEVKSVEQLKKDLLAKQTELLEARRGNAAGELANPRVLTVTRKEIARIHTAIRAAELREEESK